MHDETASRVRRGMAGIAAFQTTRGGGGRPHGTNGGWQERYTSFMCVTVLTSALSYLVADCVSLFSLDKLEVVPVDTHIFSLAKAHMPSIRGKQSLNAKVYDEIGLFFRERYSVTI